MAGTSTADTLALPQRVRKLYNDAKAARHIRVDRWQRAYRLVHNMAWAPSRDAWLPSPSASEIFPIVSAMAGWMTDIRPGTSCLPAMEPGTPIAKALQQLAQDMETVIKSSEINNEEDREIEKMLFDAMIYGTGFVKTIWDPAAADGNGDARVQRVDPFAIYPDPQCHNFDDANYILEVRRMPVQEIDRRFPGTAKKLRDRAGMIDEPIEERQDLLNGGGKTPMANTAAISPVTAPRWGLPGQSDREHVFRDEGVTVFECWMREHEMVKGKLIDRWKLVITAADEVLLEVYAEDIYAHRIHPYSRYVLTEMGEFWGISLVDHLAPLQVALNRLLAALQSHAELVGNPVFLEPANSGIPRTRITNKPGQRLTVNSNMPTGSVSWLTPPDMPQGVSDLVKFYIGEMERVSGLSAITKGQTPGGRNSEGVIDAVQEAAFVRVRLALRSLESTLRDAYRKKASLIAEFYTEPRLIAVVGNSGSQTSVGLRQNHFYARDINDDAPSPFRFSLIVQAGGSQPLSREKRQADAMQLFVVGGVDRVALLEAFDYPNRDEINQRIAQQEASGQFQPPGARQRAGRSH